MELTTSQTLDRAAEIIEERGWTKGKGWFPNPASTEPVCMEGAIRLAVEGTSHSKHEIAAIVREYLTSRFPDSINTFAGAVIPFSWNDELGRTATDVIAVLRAAAVIEEAREQQDANHAALVDVLATWAAGADS